MEKKKILISDNASAHFQEFKAKEGSYSMASLGSVQAVLDIINEDHPVKILEFGGGIGTLTGLCLKYSGAVVDTYENNDFCIAALKKNLAGFERRYKILSNYNDSSGLANQYDLVIGDGGPYELIKVLVDKSKLKRIYFEGSRWSLQSLFLKALRRKYVCKYVYYFAHGLGGAVEKIGFELLCREEKKALWRWFNYFYNLSFCYVELIKKRGLVHYLKINLIKSLRRIKFLVKIKKFLFD